jgi:hypothetical protein
MEMVAKAVEDAEVLEAEKKKSARLAEEIEECERQNVLRSPSGRELLRTQPSKSYGKIAEAQKERGILAETFGKTKRALEQLRKDFQEHGGDSETGVSRDSDDEELSSVSQDPAGTGKNDSLPMGREVKELRSRNRQSRYRRRGSSEVCGPGGPAAVAEGEGILSSLEECDGRWNSSTRSCQ